MVEIECIEGVREPCGAKGSIGYYMLAIEKKLTKIVHS
jgi:hypothetical protein